MRGSAGDVLFSMLFFHARPSTVIEMPELLLSVIVIVATRVIDKRIGRSVGDGLPTSFGWRRGSTSTAGADGVIINHQASIKDPGPSPAPSTQPLPRDSPSPGALNTIYVLYCNLSQRSTAGVSPSNHKVWYATRLHRVSPISCAMPVNLEQR